MAAQDGPKLFVRQGRNGPVVRADHGSGGYHRIDNRLFHTLNRGFEQGIEGCTAQTVNLRRLLSVGGPVAIVGT